MQFVMQPGLVYQYPALGVGLLLAGVAALGAMIVVLAAGRFLSVEFRRGHNDAAAVIFSVVGVTFAVLLAFVAMLAWDHFNKAKAASYAEAASVLDVYNASVGFGDPEASLMRDNIVGYLKTVVRGRVAGTGRRPDRRAGYDPPGEVESNSRRSETLRCGRRQSACAAAIPHGLWDAREERLLAAETTIPAVVWVVALVGGGLTIAFGSFLGVPSLGMHPAMSAALAISGALALDRLCCAPP